MVKNITVGISDELSERMEQLKEVNWSAVTRDCIEQYIKQRTSGGLEQVVSKVKAIRGNEFKKGYEFVIQNSEVLGLAALEDIAYPDKENPEETLLCLLDDLPGNENRLMDKLFHYKWDDDEGYINIKYKISSNFQKGMQEAAQELIERTRNSHEGNLNIKARWLQEFREDKEKEKITDASANTNQQAVKSKS